MVPSEIDEIAKAYLLSDSYLMALANQIEQEITVSITLGDKKMLKCLPTFVCSPPTGEEKGRFLLLDLGGTHLRIGIGELAGRKKFKICHESFHVPDEIKSGSGHGLIDYIAENIIAFADRNDLSDPIEIGFTFSFPVLQENIHHGKIIQLNKAYECRDIIGMDVVELLQKRLDASKPGMFQIKSLVNDTVGTLVAHAYHEPRTRAAVILGTGTNAAYWDYIDGDRMIVNIEWGGYGDGLSTEMLTLPLTQQDIQLDEASENPGKQTFEKMISGMYLGELFRLAAGPYLKDQFNTQYSLDTKYLWSIADAVKEDISPEILTSLAFLAKAITIRSAQLAAAAINAVHIRYTEVTGDLGEFLVAVDGSLYSKNPEYERLLKYYLGRLDKYAVLDLAAGEPLLGAGIVIAAFKIN